MSDKTKGLPATEPLPPLVNPAQCRGKTPELRCGGFKPSHLTIDYPKSDFYPIQPNNYSNGFSRDGRIIGTNLAVPYPGAELHYHHIPFRRSVDWFVPEIIGDNDRAAWEFIRKGDRNKPGNFLDGCNSCELQKVLRVQDKSHQKKNNCSGSTNNETGEPAIDPGAGDKADILTDCCVSHYPTKYIVSDDPSYKAWVDSNIDAQKERDKKQVEMLKVPWELKLLPGHYAPPIMQTSNEAYGHYLDMLPKRPHVYPAAEDFVYKPLPLMVRFQRSNMSDMPPIPDHAFAVDRKELEDSDGRPLGGFIGSPISADSHGPAPAVKNYHSNATKIPTKCDNVGTEQKVAPAGPGVKPPAPGLSAPDPWTFRRSAIVLGRVVGERARGRTWPIYMPTGLELNRPLPRIVKMSAACENSARPVQSMEVPVDPQKGVNYHEKERKPQPRRTECFPQNIHFVATNRKDPCHRDFINKETLNVPDGWRKIDKLCDAVAQRAPHEY